VVIADAVAKAEVDGASTEVVAVVDFRVIEVGVVVVASKAFRYTRKAPQHFCLTAQ
jgi:hypothetical protein